MQNLSTDDTLAPPFSAPSASAPIKSMLASTMFTRLILLFILLTIAVSSSDAECLSDSDFNETLGPVPPNSCCQQHVCNIPCPQQSPPPGHGFGIVVIVAIVLSCLIGISTFFLVRGKTENFFVAARTLPLPVLAITLAAQSIDSNALLGNVDLSYQFHFYEGAVIPIGLGLSLVLNAVFLAGPINRERLLTLPDLFAKRYGRTVEVLVSLATSVSFLFLLAGNLVGMSLILSYLLDISPSAAVWMTTGLVWAYTACGGLLSVAYTDVLQGAIGWLGCLVAAFWFIHNIQPSAAPPSRGFEGYIYPDLRGDNGVCDLYNGAACLVNSMQCCFNDAANIETDNGAFPTGDQSVFPRQMFSPTALSPFPNAILWNWATIFILAFGNLAALDFQARCMASRSPRSAAIGCVIGGCLTFLIGIPFSYLGAITRVFYGPDSVHAEFSADTCSRILGLPTCAQWLPDPLAFLRLLTNQAPAVIGGWCLFGLIAASMSTSDGAVLALGTVFAHNIVRQFRPLFPRSLHSGRLLLMARLSTLPFAVAGGAIAAYSSGVTGKLLIVAFDVVLATVVVPLFGCFYAKRSSAPAAFLSFVAGACVRIVLEFVLPKDGSFLLPYSADEFLNYGDAASLKVPTFVDAQASDVWNPASELCKQEPFKDYSGVDSLGAFVVSFVVFVVVHLVESWKGGPLFRFWGDVGYEKELEEKKDIEEKGKEIEKEGQLIAENVDDKEGAGDATGEDPVTNGAAS